MSQGYRSASQSSEPSSEDNIEDIDIESIPPHAILLLSYRLEMLRLYDLQNRINGTDAISYPYINPIVTDSLDEDGQPLRYYTWRFYGITEGQYLDIRSVTFSFVGNVNDLKLTNVVFIGFDSLFEVFEAVYNVFATRDERIPLIDIDQNDEVPLTSRVVKAFLDWLLVR